MDDGGANYVSKEISRVSKETYTSVKRDLADDGGANGPHDIEREQLNK